MTERSDPYPLAPFHMADCLEALARVTDVALVAFGHGGRVCAWSAAAERMTGLSREQTFGESLDRLDRTGARSGPALRRSLTSGGDPLELEIEFAVGPKQGSRARLRLARIPGDQGPILVGSLEPMGTRDGGTADAVGIVAESGVMREVLRRLRRAAESQVTTLIRGESGTGKELAARAIHAWSPRAERPFVAIHCAALSPSLLEAELFGHVRGAFTGAETSRSGVFVEASGGTLFLDEIGELSPDVQVKLLRTLQEREVRPVGSDRTVPIDVRLVTATNRDLARGLEDGTIREDFYYRIRVFEIAIPPLRERREDVLPIAHRLLGRIAHDGGASPPLLAEDAERALLGHSWPGNVRELENALEHASVICEHGVIHADCLPPELRSRSRGSSAPIGALGLESGSEAERERILHSLERHGWNRTATAEALGISRVTLWKKIRAFHLDEGIFRRGSRPEDQR